MNDPIITFTSDFGTREYYVGAVKGVMASIAPQARIVDVSHEVASHDLLEGSFTLACAYDTFPARTIHLVVVDPGVGSERRRIVAVTERHCFVAPDNGLLSLVYERENVTRVISIEAQHYFRRPVSPTFHARDIFGPVAAWLATGIDPRQFGPEVADYVRMSVPAPELLETHRIAALVLHIDRFGNLITSLRPEDVRRLLGDLPPATAQLGEQLVHGFARFYAGAPGDDPFVILGSSGYYEIAANRRPAARLLNAKRGSRVLFGFD